MATTEKLIIKLEADNRDLKRKLDSSKKQMGGLGKAAGQVGLAIGAAFGVQQLGGFIKDQLLIAGQMEGIQAAFNKLNELIKRSGN